MGVADNKTYRDQSHFSDKLFKIKGEDYPSINDEDKINSTIKDNPYRSNVEIEGREVVLQPDLSALFKAVGKRHSKGGMDVLLKPNSFIFSDDKTLAVNEKEHKLFELKEGGNYKPTNNTPAAVLKRNVDVKHYNTLVNNLQDIKKDELTKKSSAMMLENYIQLLGNIAYIQENKKGFPEGLPSFSQGTAPVYNSEVKGDVESAKQFRKYGGHVMATGGGYDPECPCGRDANGHCIQNCPEQDYLKLLPQARKVKSGEVPAGYNQLYQNSNATLYGKFDVTKQSNPYSGAKMSNQEWINFLRNESPSHKAQRLAKNSLKTNEDYLQVNPTVTPGYAPPPAQPEPAIPEDVLPTPGTVTPGGDITKKADWQFTPWQKISQAYNFGQFANVKRYMPYRSRYNATYMDPALLNEQQAVGNARGVANQNLQSLNTLNPILRNAQAQSGYGQLLDQIPQIGLNVENQNVGIKNQTRQYNNQIKNQETLQNMQNDQNYYKEAVLGRQNFDNLRQYTANNAMNNVMRDVETNQKLAYNILTQNRPVYGFDWRTGNLTRNKGIDIREADNLLPQDSWQSMVNQVQKLKRSGLSDQVVSSLVRGQFFKQAAPYFQQSQTPPPFPYKKGGYYNPFK